MYYLLVLMWPLVVFQPVSKSDTHTDKKKQHENTIINVMTPPYTFFTLKLMDIACSRIRDSGEPRADEVRVPFCACVCFVILPFLLSESPGQVIIGSTAHLEYY